MQECIYHPVAQSEVMRLCARRLRSVTEPLNVQPRQVTVPFATIYNARTWPRTVETSGEGHCARIKSTFCKGKPVTSDEPQHEFRGCEAVEARINSFTIDNIKMELL